MGRAIADYVDQRKYLPFQRASEIASHLAGPLIDQFGIPADTDHDLFLCSLYYKTFIASEFDEEFDLPVARPAVAVEAPSNPESNPESTEKNPFDIEDTQANGEVPSGSQSEISESAIGRIDQA